VLGVSKIIRIIVVKYFLKYHSDKALNGLSLMMLAVLSVSAIAKEVSELPAKKPQIIFPKMAVCGDIMVGMCLRPDKACLAKEAKKKAAKKVKLHAVR
jgi:hypothetical protein